MADQSDKIEASPAIVTKTAIHLSSLGPQQQDAASDEGGDEEKQDVSERSELKRKLKSRHLQMIAIGLSLRSTLLHRRCL
jgi:amino acid permease